MSDLPEITILNDFLGSQRDILKERVKNKNSRKFADIRRSIENNKLFNKLKTDTGHKLTFFDSYVGELYKAKSIYQLYRIIESIQLNHTARMSGKAISETVINNK